MRFTMKFSKVLASFALSLFFHPALTLAQYTRTDLVSDDTDPNLVNGWGLTRSSGSPFWVSDNGTGLSTLYNGAGHKVPLTVTIPSAPNGAATGTPTGTVFNITLGNPTPSFSLSKTASVPAIFLFATQDGTISGWNPGVDGTHALIAADRSKDGAVYTGLAITSDASGDFLYAADNRPNSRIDVFDKTFTRVNSFTDSSIPAGLAPYGIQNIGGNLWVTFASNKPSVVGFVVEFNPAGTVLMRFSGPLHSPWGLAMAPANFGPFSGKLLVSNNVPDGKINAFDPASGAFLGTLRDAEGEDIVINQVWALQFGNGGNGGQPTQLFFTAGPNQYRNGLFGVITANP